MKVELLIEIPQSAYPEKAHAMLVEMAALRQGITITTPMLDCIDVDLITVTEVLD